MEHIIAFGFEGMMLDFLSQYGYYGLFVASFLAATILPIGSEFVFSALIIAKFDVWACIIIASIGNWLGGMTNYYLGKLGKIEWIEKYLKISHDKILKMQKFLAGKGAFMAFFSFLPVIGDIIALALGFMRANIYIVNFSMFLGKFIRYIILAYGIMYGIKWFEI